MEKKKKHLSLQIRMEENTSSQAEINSIAYLDKKRKQQDELLEMPLPKHVCRDQHLEFGSSLDSSTKPKKVKSNEFTRGGESDPESKNSNSLNSNSDIIMCTDDEVKTDLEYPETSMSDVPSGTSSDIGLYSSESKSSSNSSSSEPESLSISKRPDCPHHQYEGCLVEFGSLADFSSSEYGNTGIEQCITDKVLENLLYSNGVAPNSNYILSSGRWSVNQDTQQEGKKQTIDKEFEQYFSMLML